MPRFLLTLACSIALLAGCRPDAERVGLGQAGHIQDPALDEISGLQAGIANPDVLYAHNDDGAPLLHVIDRFGRSRGQVRIDGANHVDWEDITALNLPDGPLLAIGDIGDNHARRSDIALYFVAEPRPGPDGRFSGSIGLRHRILLRYPDGARDCEALAFDPAGERLLFVTKRDTPPRIYALPLERALSEPQAELEFLGETHRFRPPTPADLRRFGVRDGRWVSQPTGIDISADGRSAAVISYRSLYLFRRGADQDWASALAGNPIEIEAPPSQKEEAVTFHRSEGFLYVTTEGLRPPLYRFDTGNIAN